MVHALKEIHRVLAPGGVLLDIRPISGATPLEVVREGKVELAGHFDESKDDPDDVAANNAVSRAVRRSLFHREKSGQFDFAYYWDAVDEMRAYVKEKWTASKLPGSVSRKARRLMAPGDGRVRARVTVIISRLRKV
ncbi:MAG: hypothetical protein HY260_19750 [Chloroflexi bacterium]|nr:hypothetical protein [Chloroflexota bacterium]